MRTQSNRVSVRYYIVLCLLIIVVAIGSCTLITRCMQEVERDVPTVVSDFLKEYCAADEYVYPEGEDPFEGRFADYKAVDPELYLEGEIDGAFNQVFRDFDFGTETYRVERVANNFIKVYLLDSEDGLLPPPIGFWYKVSAAGEIVEWRVARLQPFSKYDAEYSEVWEDIHG